MQKKVYHFSSKEVTYYFDAEFSYLEKLTDKNNTVIITDENVFNSNKRKFSGWKTIIVKAGEEFKVQTTIDLIINQLIELGTDRKTFIVGVGGGVITDITGFVASIYMRGVKFGFAPSSILAMVDASIGGKNGIDVGVYKNLVGLIKQPEFLLFDISFLRSLPKEEWVNGFAEVIKHAAIKDAALFRELEKHKISFYQKDKGALSKLIRKNVLLKTAVVQKDEYEKGERRLLNFGHTIGHAIEKLYKLPHGHAVSIGMVAACLLSEQFLNFRETDKIINVLKKYGLPTFAQFNSKKVFEILKMDKKKEQHAMNYVMLKKIGLAEVKQLPVDDMEGIIQSITMSR
jgi:3-dehydroquinate synthase